MRKICFIILTVFAFCCNQKDHKKEQIIFNRIEFVYQLKQYLDEKTWKTFNEKEYDLPLIYFTYSGSYIANPTNAFLQTFESDLVFENSKIKIYKSKSRVDDLPFHMETSITLGDSSNDYNYHSPFMNCSSYEEVHKVIPVVLSTEQWATMVIHEYFHGFQYKHKPFLDFYEKEITYMHEDSLHTIYKSNAWFKASIDKENQLVLNAIHEKDSVNRQSMIRDFFTLRNDRRQKVANELKTDISKYEKCYETIEGTARYVEYALYHLFSTQPDDQLLKSDPSFKSFEKFRHYNIEKDHWLYLTEKTKYFYAIGFNMARLLDKLNIEYKSKLFQQEPTSLEDILKESQKAR
ncbi:hypothetical protein [Polluticaenibacter yanchengensis]|uniref:Aminopeptidase n=1 Tax=Polluticaenibacter yanchengensis TaxID=3014562 RepID=A0ABT4UM76_9BACT|nr:hypothetical protein [Chitinophagaceae bacterium LY-5]